MDFDLGAQTSVDIMPITTVTSMESALVDFTALDLACLESGNDILIQLVMLRLKLSDIVGIELSGVSKDAWAWLAWMKNGGTRPKRNKRSTSIIPIAQSWTCNALEPYYGLIDWTNSEHFALLERVTRPLPAVALAKEPANPVAKS